MVQVSAGADPQAWLDVNGQVDDDIDFAWRCEAPVRVGLWQRPYKVVRNDVIVGVHAAWVSGGEWHMKVPCRKCWPCQLQRKREWIAKAINEAKAAHEKGGRTWLFTGTFREDPKDNHSLVVDEYQRYMKRLRKSANTSIRYIAVLENGERNGRLHVHILLHANLKWRDVVTPWTAGFKSAKLVRLKVDQKGQVDADSARMLYYVAGYITGDVKFRVRASLRYGKNAPPLLSSESAGTPSCKPQAGATNPSGTPPRDHQSPVDIGAKNQQWRV